MKTNEKQIENNFLKNMLKIGKFLKNYIKNRKIPENNEINSKNLVIFFEKIIKKYEIF